MCINGLVIKHLTTRSIKTLDVLFNVYKTIENV